MAEFLSRKLLRYHGKNPVLNPSVGHYCGLNSAHVVPEGDLTRSKLQIQRCGSQPIARWGQGNLPGAQPGVSWNFHQSCTAFAPLVPGYQLVSYKYITDVQAAQTRALASIVPKVWGRGECSTRKRR